MKRDAIAIKEQDNVATALRNLARDEEASVGVGEKTVPITVVDTVEFGHKFAIVDIPAGVTDPSTVLPVQVYLWADSPERAFVERTSAAIMVLLGFLVLMNGVAIYLRKKFERRW